MRLVEMLGERLGCRFSDPELALRALTHRSFAEEHEGALDNQRLEFLGDAVIELVVTEMLVHAFGSAPEGALSRIRAALVRTSSLAALARRLGIGELLRLGRGEEATGGREKDRNLEDAFEAVAGALYLDGGLDLCRDVLARLFAPRIAGIGDPSTYGIDPKSRLQEREAAAGRQRPAYSVVGLSGPEHARSFRVEVRLAAGGGFEGQGSSKKEAEQAAARAALEAGGDT